MTQTEYIEILLPIAALIIVVKSIETIVNCTLQA